MKPSDGRTVWAAVLNDPFRLFFPLGILFGIAGTGHWLVYGSGWTDAYSGYYHAAVQIWLYMGSFVAGFLLTAIPRFASAPRARTGEVLALLALMAAEYILLSLQNWIAAEACFLAWLGILLAFIGRRFSERKVASPPPQFVWIPFAFLHGIAGILTVMMSQEGAVAAVRLQTGRSLVELGFLLCLVTGIGGFLGPRLLGHAGAPDPEALRAMAHRSRVFTHAAWASALFATFWIDGEIYPRLAPAARALIVTSVFAMNGVLRRPSGGLFRKLLALSFWLVPAGLWGAALVPDQRVTMLHVVFLGGFGLMTFLVSSMVVLSHSGNGHKTSEPLWIFKIAGGGLLSALLVRSSAQFMPEHYFLHLGAASGIWILTGAAWLAFAVPYLFKTEKTNGGLR